MSTSTETHPLLNNKTYDVLKFIALILLPASGAAYFTLSQIWGLPNGEQVVGTITVVDTFLGALLGVSSRAYNNSDAKYDGTVKVIETPNKKTFALQLNGDPEKLDEMDTVTFKVEGPNGG